MLTFIRTIHAWSGSTLTHSLAHLLLFSFFFIRFFFFYPFVRLQTKQTFILMLTPSLFLSLLMCFIIWFAAIKYILSTIQLHIREKDTHRRVIRDSSKRILKECIRFRNGNGNSSEKGVHAFPNKMNHSVQSYYYCEFFVTFFDILKSNVNNGLLHHKCAEWFFFYSLFRKLSLDCQTYGINLVMEWKWQFWNRE